MIAVISGARVGVNAATPQKIGGSISGMDINNNNNEVTTASFAKLINSRPVVLVDFSATWCGPCKHLAPKIEELKTELPGKFALLKSDVDRDAALADSMNIEAMPTLMIYKNGELKWRQTGDLDKSELFQAVMSVQ